MFEVESVSLKPVLKKPVQEEPTPSLSESKEISFAQLEYKPVAEETIAKTELKIPSKKRPKKEKVEYHTSVADIMPEKEDSIEKPKETESVNVVLDIPTTPSTQAVLKKPKTGSKQEVSVFEVESVMLKPVLKKPAQEEPTPSLSE